MTNRKYDRPEVKQVSKQWVKENCKYITKRDMGLLQLLYHNNRRLLRRDQIESLYPFFSSTDRLNKRLSTLYKLHIIDKIYPSAGLGEGSSKQHICLDRAGLILLNVDKYNKPISSDKSGNKFLPLGWEHKVMINEYECRLRQLCKENNLTMPIYIVEPDYEYRGKKIKPDIVCLIANNKVGHLFFIEVDMGTEDIPYIKDKLLNYTEYYSSRLWIKEKWARVFKNPSFPKLIFLTENGRNRRVQSIEKYSQDLPISVMVGEHKDLQNIILSLTKGT